mmetsp:Transcript_10644/g.36124  ORF Transcript_10644/g.36124 Transcript_10644/m.36124 type:complete len:940 (+) Transcript_10644:155-2974(+)
MELCVSYAVMGLLNPELFPQPPSAAAQGPERILSLLEADASASISSEMPPGFLAKLAEHAAAEGCVDDLAHPLFTSLAAAARRETILTNFQGPLRQLAALLECKALRFPFVTHPDFKPRGAVAPPMLPPHIAMSMGGQPPQPAPGAPPNGRAYEQSLLGAFLRPSGMPPDGIADLVASGGPTQTVAAQLFAGVSKSSPHQVEANLTTLRLSSQLLRDGVHVVIAHLLRCKEAQPRVFEWLGGAISTNQERATEMYRQGQEASGNAASLGFVYNLCHVLLKFCEPFADPWSPQVAKIDSTFLLSAHRFDCAKDTRLSASEDALMHWLDPRNEDARQRYLRHAAASEAAAPAEASNPSEALPVSETFGTISEYFFCTARALHVGFVPGADKLAHLDQQHYRMHQEIRRLRESGEDPARLEQLERQQEDLTATRLCYEAHLNDKAFTGAALRFQLLVLGWHLRTVAEAAGSSETDAMGLVIPKLPLPPTPPKLFACQPEHLMDNALKTLQFCGRYDREQIEALTDQQLALVLTFCVVFLGAPKYVTNPYLRAHLTEVLAQFVPRKDARSATGFRQHRMAAVLAGHAIAREHLPAHLMQFFVDIEFTGSHTQFHDKFTYRHHMAQVLEHLWTIPEYREAIVAVSQRKERFVRFVNFILNDALYCMDEALRKLAKIREVELEMKDVAAWNAAEEEHRNDRASELRAAEEQGGYFMQLANEIVRMLHYLSSDARVAAALLAEELRDRVANMLNHFVMRLVGPSCLELKVADMSKYHFDPWRLLAEIAEIYLHLAGSANGGDFVAAVVADQRSFDAALFDRAVDKVLHRMLKETNLEAFKALIKRLREAEQEQAEMEEDLGEVPDEFLCLITAELMRDPVTLPSSQSVVERAAILRHLLSDSTDPFNRATLTEDMLVPNDELKERIAAWKAERLAEKKKDQVMDVG